jgi:hypothetical protein
MKTISLFQAVLPAAILFFTLSCQKEAGDEFMEQQQQQEEKKGWIDEAGVPSFNLNVTLHGKGKQFGYLKFRQDEDAAKIITLDVWVLNLKKNHEYLLQRAVDPANEVDGNCTSTTWLTLGKGLTPQSILTNYKGRGKANLWRDITAIPSGTAFDIHFRVVDATTMAVILDSHCYEYVVR